MSGPVIFVLPGASLMRVALLDNNIVRVECPGCGAVQTYRPVPAQVQHQPFRHAFDTCPTLAEIDRALLRARHPERVQ